METTKQRNERKERAQKQLSELGYVSLKNKYSPEKIEKAMWLSCGSLKVLATLLKVTQNQILVYLNCNKEARELWNQIRQQQLDRAEEVVDGLLDSKNERIKLDAAKFILQNRHPDYKQQRNVQEISVDDGKVSIRSIFGLSDED